MDINKKILKVIPLIISTVIYLGYSDNAMSEEAVRTEGGGKEYIIKKGDTLWDISGEYLQDPFLWPNIWQMNKYIKNPDLIYPGNRLVIPPVMPSSPVSGEIEAPLAPAEATIPVAVPEEPAIPEIPIAAEVPEIPEPPEIPASLYPAALEPAPVEEAAVPETVRRDVKDRELIYASGYIAEDAVSWGIITGSPEGKNIFAAGDNVDISLSKKDNEVSVGDRFTIFKPPDYIIHPKTKKRIGRLFIPVGVLEIYRVQGERAAGKIITSYTNSSAGDYIQPYYSAAPLVEIGPVVPDLLGYIVESREGNVLISEQNIVYIDKGAYDGISPGATLYVAGDRPDDIIGEIKVISIQAHTSTAVVVKSVEPFGIGSRIITGIK